MMIMRSVSAIEVSLNSPSITVLKIVIYNCKSSSSSNRMKRKSSYRYREKMDLKIF